MSFTLWVPPMLTRAQSGGMPDIFGNLLSGYQEGQKAKYLKPSLEEALKKAQIANKHAELANTHAKMANDYYKPLNDSLLELRKAQTGSAQAHMQKSQSEAQQLRLIQMIQAHMLGGNPGMMGGGDQGSNQGGMPIGGTTQANPDLSPYLANPTTGNAGSPEQEQYGLSDEQMARLYKTMPPPKTAQGSSATPSSNYAQTAMISHLLGLGQPQVVQDASGKFVATSPLGNADTGVSGLSERDKALSKEDAKKISSLENTAITGYEKQDTFDAMNNILGSDEFAQMRQHPVAGKYELGYYKKFGTPTQQKMVGDMSAYMGQIIKDAAQDFKGQFRVGEQALVFSMKPNENDSLDVMKGKAEALTYMNQMLTKRSELEAKYMRKYNMSALEAKMAADKVIKPSEIKKQVNSMLYPEKKSGNSSAGEMITIRNKKTGETITVPREEARKRGIDV